MTTHTPGLRTALASWRGITAQPAAFPTSRFTADYCVQQSDGRALRGNRGPDLLLPTEAQTRSIEQLLDAAARSLQDAAADAVCGFAVDVDRFSASTVQIWTGPAVSAATISLSMIAELPGSNRIRWRDHATPRLQEAVAGAPPKPSLDRRRLIATSEESGELRLSNGPLTAGTVQATVATAGTLGDVLDRCAAWWETTFDEDPVADLFAVEVCPATSNTPLIIQFW